MAKFIDPLDNSKPFQIPDKFWEQLNEFTAGGGWICFYCDHSGKLNLEANFSSEMAEEAIRSFGARFLNSLTNAKEIAETESFLGNGNNPDEFDEEL
jgi:hypothetical protein